MDKNKKILFIMQVPPPVTGATLRNSEIVEIFSGEDDFSIKLIPMNFAKHVSGLSKFSLKKVFISISLYLRTLFELLFFRPDIVYMTPVPSGFAYWRDILLITILKIFRKKTLYHLRPLGFVKGSKESRIKRKLNRFIFRNVSVICLSKHTSEDIKGIYDADPYILNNGIRTINEGIKVKNIGDKTNMDRAPVILFYSNLFKAKGVWDFLEILSILKNEGEKFSGKIYGQEGDIKCQQLEKTINDMGLSDCVEYQGVLSDESKYEALMNGDIFVFPTHNENFPGVVLEAMQSSLPIVTVYEGSISEIVLEGKTGFLNQKGDNKGGAESIRKLIRDKYLREKMGKAGKERFLKKFTMDVFRKNIIDLINTEFRDRNKRERITTDISD